eukprot:TRINITY_DN1005_c2_g1_i1.p1 TRINITY_DN1005_c2_g1~~TRINITY_DN1005_c2_g1_i1.p1  ORF type:complete len:152 (-),score=7.64 TRINITY_DN1005_c2_g1_i1:107-562(-)
MPQYQYGRQYQPYREDIPPMMPYPAVPYPMMVPQHMYPPTPPPPHQRRDPKSPDGAQIYPQVSYPQYAPYPQPGYAPYPPMYARSPEDEMRGRSGKGGYEYPEYMGYEQGVMMMPLYVQSMPQHPQHPQHPPQPQHPQHRRYEQPPPHSEQ